jgi:hypothetical protein
MKAERVSLSFQCSSRPLRPRYSRTPLQRVDALFQFAAIDGERVFAAESGLGDLEAFARELETAATRLAGGIEDHESRKSLPE